MKQSKDHAGVTRGEMIAAGAAAGVLAGSMPRLRSEGRTSADVQSAAGPDRELVGLVNDG